MALYVDELQNWTAIHFADGRTVVPADKAVIPACAWEFLLHKVPVWPMNQPGHYEALNFSYRP